MPAIRAAECPRERLIVDFSRGKLDDATAETVSAHLETCIDCRAAADRVAADSFIQRLRAAHGQIPAPAALSSQADSVSRADSATVSIKPAASQVLPSEPDKSSLPAELVDHPDYALIKELGRGGMGVVYLARNRAMDRLEVLKIVSKALVEQPGARERFQREIRSAAKLSHPNIVAAYSVPRAGDLLIFAMEHVAGQDLSQVVKQRGPLPVVNAAYYAHQVALGLQHAHEQGMVHRDIKPNNLILSVQAKRHLVKILDFGLAKATSEKLSSSELTGSGQMLGTPDYMAPEQSLDAHEADIRADIYSLGCTLYFMLAGRPPFQGPSMYSVLSAHHSNTARLLSEVRSDVPAELAAVVAKMMAKDPADRYQTPADVSQALGPFYRAASGEAAKLTPMTEEAVSREISVDAFDPYYQWLGIAPEEQPVDHYRLLGTKRFEANPEVIANLADQRMAHLRTFQDGEQGPLSRKLLKEIAAARVCLLKADRKAAYDAELRRSIAARLQALPPLAPPLAAVAASAAAPPALPELSPARNAAAWAKRSMASLQTRLGMDRLPPAVRYTALGSFAALIVLCAVVIKISTPDGEVTVEVNKSNAEVVSDGQKATVRWDNNSKRADVSVPLGSHKVEVTTRGVKASGQEVTVEENAKTVLTAKLESPVKSTPVKPPASGTESVHQGNQPWESAAFQQWMKDVAAMPPEQQVKAVAMKLRELNPDFAGKETHTIESGAVTEFSFVADDVADISPIRALAGLAALGCSGSGSMRRGVALSDLSPLRGMRLAKLECIFTNVRDLSPLKGMPLTTLNVAYTRVADLSALKGMQLTDFACGGTPVSDLSPLEGMPITRLNFVITDVTDLSPLRGMPMRVLFFGKTGVADLSPLKGMPLDSLDCTGVRVSDLSPLAGMKLRELRFTPAKITKGIDVIRQMESIASFFVGYPIQRSFKPDEFWKKYDTGDFFSPDARTDLKKWLTEVASLSAEKQIEAVSSKLQEINPGFDGKLTGFGGKGTPTIENGVVTELGFSTNDVTNISPVRALTGLKKLNCSGNGTNRWGQLSDLSPLKGLPLTELICACTRLSDLSPLVGMKLVSLQCGASEVCDLSPLKGMPLVFLNCGSTQVSDLSPLAKSPLACLWIDHTRVTDLSPLAGLPLSELRCSGIKASNLSPLKGLSLTRLEVDNTPVADLSPLDGMQLKLLTCDQTQVSDLSPLKGMSLVVIHLTPRGIAKGLGIIRQMKTLDRVGLGWGAPEFPVDEFWKKYDAGEFGDPHSARGINANPAPAPAASAGSNPEAPDGSPPALLRAPFDGPAAKAAQQQWAKHLNRKVVETNSFGMKLALIPPGEFMMGSPGAEVLRHPEETQHRVRVTQALYMGVYDVTRGQFATFVTPARYQTEAEADGKGGMGYDADGKLGLNPKYTFWSWGKKQADDHPVVNVSWNDAQAFCKFLSAMEGKKYRLPTEAEWEYACRAGTTTPFSFGSSLNGRQANCDGNRPYGIGERGPFVGNTTPVGTYSPNAFGLYDMHGNVLEWCRDCYGLYSSNSPIDDPRGPSGDGSHLELRVIRGGSWNYDASLCRSAFRTFGQPEYRNNILGFRVVCER